MEALTLGKPDLSGNSQSEFRMFASKYTFRCISRHSKNLQTRRTDKQHQRPSFCKYFLITNFIFNKLFRSRFITAARIIGILNLDVFFFVVSPNLACAFSLPRHRFSTNATSWTFQPPGRWKIFDPWLCNHQSPSVTSSTSRKLFRFLWGLILNLFQYKSMRIQGLQRTEHILAAFIYAQIFRRENYLPRSQELICRLSVRPPIKKIFSRKWCNLR